MLQFNANRIRRSVRQFIFEWTIFAVQFFLRCIYLFPLSQKSVFITGDAALTGGTFRYLANLVQALRNAGFSVTLGTRHKSDHKHIRQLAQRNGLRYITRPDLPFPLDTFILAMQVISARSSKIIVTAASVGVHSFSLLLGVQNFHIYHTAPEGRQADWVIWLFRHCLSKNDALIAVSRHAHDSFQKHFAIAQNPHANILTVLNGVEEVTLPSLKTDVDRKVILTLGHVAPHKNVDAWAKTAEYVLSRCQDAGPVEFVWAGDGPDLQKWKEKYRENPQIKFIGFLRDPSGFFGSATIYFQPSKRESFGLAVAEALSCGLPCVVSNQGGLPELVIEGLNGFVREPEDFQGFGEAILVLLKNDSIRGSLSFNARKRYEDFFTFSRWSSDIVKAISHTS